MAIEFARVQYVKRSDGGNVCRSAAYNAREDIHCERTGERFYFAHRELPLHHDVLLPEGASNRFLDVGTLWNAAQAAEKRKDAQEAREVLLALPSNPGLDLEDWRQLTEDFAREHFVSKGVAVQVDIHAPHEGETNFHAHLLITTRRIEGDHFSKAKARDLDPEIRTRRGRKPLVTEAEAWGATWRDHQNKYFADKGLDVRVDDIGVVAQTHEGPVRMRTKPEEARGRAEANAAENDSAMRDPEKVLAALTRNRATFTELDVERLLKKHIKDAEERSSLRESVLKHASVLTLHDREDGSFTGRYTTTIVREEEVQVLAAASAINQQREQIDESHRNAALASRSLDAEQEAAFLKATGTDGLVVIEGRAGTGKSYNNGAIREAHEQDNWHVIGLAPTNSVADDLRNDGFARASTVHLELLYQEGGRHDRAPAWNAKTCVMVEEAAMLDTRTYNRLLRHAAATGAKVVLTGDDRQNASVERGGMFTEVKSRVGSTVISRVRRQEKAWQQTASDDFSQGTEDRMAKGLRAYAEHGHVHWTDDLEESRIRLLSDWDQDSRERPDVNRFVYASTNAEVEQLNQAIRDIRVRRGDVDKGTTVDTDRGRFDIGAGDRIQFFSKRDWKPDEPRSKDRAKNAELRELRRLAGSMGTVVTIEGTQIVVRTDGDRYIRFDSAEFKQFGLGYAGTVYRGQGKTKTEVYALYDSAFAWNAKTAYVGLTRHRVDVGLYVPRTLAENERALAKQMSRRMRDEASMAYATAAEVIDLQAARCRRAEAQTATGKDPAAPARTGTQKTDPAGSVCGDTQQTDAAGAARKDAHKADRVRPGRAARTAAAEPTPAGTGGSGRVGSQTAGAETAGGFPRAEVAALRQLDLTAYARDAHGYTVHVDPAWPNHFILTRPSAGGPDRLQVRHAGDGHWTWRNPDNPRERGDILDLAVRHGARNLTEARKAVAAYQAERSAFSFESLDGITKLPPAQQAEAVAKAMATANDAQKKRLEEFFRKGDGRGTDKPGQHLAPEVLAAYEAKRRQAMQEPRNRRREVEERGLPEFHPNDPDADVKRAAAAEERKHAIAGAEHEDRVAGIAADEEKRLAFVKEEADRKARVDAEYRDVIQTGQARFQEMQQKRPQHHDADVADQAVRAEEARQRTGIAGPEATARQQRQLPGNPDAYPASASLRYSESLARNYDGRDHYGSLSRAQLSEAAAMQRERFDLDRKIALEGDPDHRDMLMLRRDIEHNDYMAQSWQRIAGQSRVIGGPEHTQEAARHQATASVYRDEAREARALWEQNAIQNPSLYPPLNAQMRARVEAARERVGVRDETPAVEPGARTNQQPAASAPTRAVDDERAGDGDAHKASLRAKSGDRQQAADPRQGNERPAGRGVTGAAETDAAEARKAYLDRKYGGKEGTADPSRSEKQQPSRESTKTSETAAAEARKAYLDRKSGGKEGAADPGRTKDQQPGQQRTRRVGETPAAESRKAYLLNKDGAEPPSGGRGQDEKQQQSKEELRNLLPRNHKSAPTKEDFDC